MKNMLLKFQYEYRSIQQINDIELPNFSILTGKNGSGKTQILEAIDKDAITIEGINSNEIMYFDLTKFRIQNEGEFTQQQLTNEKLDAWNFFINKSNSKNYDITNSLKSFKSTFNDDEIAILNQICEEKQTSLLSLNSLTFDETMNQKLQNYQNQVLSIFNQQNLLKHPYKYSILDIFKNYHSFYDEITEDEFKDLFFPKTLKDDFLPIMLGKSFLEYRIKEFLAFHNTLLNNQDGIVKELEDRSEKEFREKHHGFTPWELLNNFLITFGDFDYVITYPNKITMNDYHNKSDSTFIPKLKNRDKILSINYSEL